LFLLLSSCQEQKFVGELSDWPGVKQGHLRAYSTDGILVEEASFIKDTLEGERILYYTGGNVNIRENYRKGHFHGPYTKYHPNGKLYIEGNYVSNEMVGLWKTFYKSGALKEKVTFANNLENGPFTEFYENGNIKAEGAYQDGDKEHGLLLLYDSTGLLIRRMECNMGICNTIWKLEGIE
jgi:antitoxin component YwqK of YwqJK toxin-antitoxin module